MLFIIFFIVVNSTFSAKFTYDPLDFTIKARYVKPIKVEFDDATMSLGYFMETESLNGNRALNKTFGITISGEPLDTVTLLVSPTITITNLPRNKTLTIKQSLADTALNIATDGTASTLITFTSDDIIQSNGYGTYTGETTITVTVN